MAHPLKIGMLGAARIGYFGLIKPASEIDGVEAFAIAARDPERANKYARKHRIPKVHQHYNSLLADPDIDAIYNPLPNALHCEWTIKALDAGKHVLCEKPLANNADEAHAMRAAAHRNQRVLMEAFHYRHHPLAARMQAITAQLGALELIDVGMCFPLPAINDIRFNYGLGGGATMDVGAYTSNILRLLAAASGVPSLQEVPDIVLAQAKLLRPNVDRAMRAECEWPNGTRGIIENSLLSSKLFRISARVRGSRGEMHAINPVAPQFFNRINYTIDGVKHCEKIAGKATYTLQLEAFAQRIASGETHSDLSDSIDNMRMIDAIYEAAGLPRRGTKTD